MKKIAFMTIACSLALTSCSDHGLNSDLSQQTQTNAETILGRIDPNQDWSSINSISLSLTADAPLREIVKVQILTQSPFFNNQGKILAEKQVGKGETVTLNFDAPKAYDRLIAACVDGQGHYYVKGFDINQGSLSFKKTANKTRGGATRAADENYPSLSQLTLHSTNTLLSYNAQRAEFIRIAEANNDAGMLDVVDKGHISAWKNSGWSDRLWLQDNGETKLNDTWTRKENSIRRVATPMTEEELQELKDVAGDFLEREDASRHWGRKNNLVDVLRNSDAVKLYNNELTSDGKTPITVTPIWMASSEIPTCHLYYYYYSPSAIPGGMSQQDYIKTLPKFKAIHCSQAYYDYRLGSNIARSYEYLLPYYGEPSSFMPTTVNVSNIASTDGKVYRIRCLGQRNGEDYYMTYTGTEKIHLATKYADAASSNNLQFWQVYTLNSDGTKLLYNVGAKKFLYYSGGWDTYFTDNYDLVVNSSYKFDEEGHIYRKGRTSGLGANWAESSKINNMMIISDKGTNVGDYSKWSFEEVSGKASTQAQLQQLPGSVTPSQLAIPAGYRIGFMLRKTKDAGGHYNNSADYRDLTDSGHGCTFSYGGLNKEIITLPNHFQSSATYFEMKADDPRMAYFTANGKAYIAFEDGSDSQYNDMIIEVGGYDQKVFEADDEKEIGFDTEILMGDLPEVDGMAYTMCFEDRPHQADYDMNDLVIRCVRDKDQPNVVEFTILAVGAEDDIMIGGIDGTPLEGQTDLTGSEVHEFFDVADKTGSERFVNTLAGKGSEYEVVSSKYKVDASLTIPQLLNKMYIVNRTQGGNTIRVPEKGQAPFALIVPGDFNYPIERQSIIGAYEKFKTWVQDINQYDKWPNYQVEGKVIINRYNQ